MSMPDAPLPRFVGPSIRPMAVEPPKAPGWIVVSTNCNSRTRRRVPGSTLVCIDCPDCNGTGRFYDTLRGILVCRRCHGERVTFVNDPSLDGILEPEPPSTPNAS